MDKVRLDRLLNVARSQLGTTEYPKGTNKVKYNTEFYGKVVSGDNYPWCVTFVWWCCKHAGTKIYDTASTSGLYNHYLEMYPDRVYKKPFPGAIVLFKKGHTGLCITGIKSNGYFETIEGNTSPGDEGSQDNGGCVAHKHRQFGVGKWGEYWGFVDPWGVFADGNGSYNFEWNSNSYNNAQVDQSINLYKNKKQDPVPEPIIERRTFDVTTSTLETVQETNLNRTKSTSLLSFPSRVESPFIIIKIGKHTFGTYTKTNNNGNIKVEYPNYVQSMTVTKINGKVNQYTINLTYQIEAGSDPNLIDKILSTVGYGTIKITYGDWSSPSFVYKEEEALITKVTSNVDFANSRISYVLSCTSNSISLLGSSYTFPARKAKPSTIIQEMLWSSTYGLTDIFTGMKNKVNVLAKNLIVNDDRVVDIEAKIGMDPISYINYLVTCMCSNTSDPSSPLRDSSYYMVITDDVYNDMGGPYFSIKKVMSNTKTIHSSDTYEIDIGYPGETPVLQFNIVNDDSWSLLYDYSSNISNNDYVYNIDNKGNIYSEYSPNITTSNKFHNTTQVQKSWWTNMTRFPIRATIVIKGLIRPAMLMTYLRVNAFFYGQRHISSGVYVITKQVDTIDGNGYRTTLSLLRVSGDEDYFAKKTTKVERDVIVGYKQPANSNKPDDTVNKVQQKDETALFATAEDGGMLDSEYVSTQGGISGERTSKLTSGYQQLEEYLRSCDGYSSSEHSNNTNWNIKEFSKDPHNVNRCVVYQYTIYYSDLYCSKTINQTTKETTIYKLGVKDGLSYATILVDNKQYYVNIKDVKVKIGSANKSATQTNTTYKKGTSR